MTLRGAVKMPKISIITPVYNNIDTIKRCIESVQCQTYTEVEHIIADGISTDGTLELVKKHAEKHDNIKFISKKDSGVYDGMNNGIEIASGDWILFLGSDDYLANENVLKEVFGSESYDNSDIIIASAQYENGKKIDGKLDDSIIFRNSIHHQGCFYRAELLKERNFDLAYKIYSDYDYNIYLHKKGVKAATIDKLISYCANFGLSDVPKLKNYIEEIKVRRKHYPLYKTLPYDALSIVRFVGKKMKQ
ncbi:MAG: glycosyltransferase [Alphaproteobacteria bacterium]|nr:glycosyltransferase [Alphaproteobacteria bacterium]